MSIVSITSRRTLFARLRFADLYNGFYAIFFYDFTINYFATSFCSAATATAVSAWARANPRKFRIRFR